MSESRSAPPPLVVKPSRAAEMLDCSRAHVYALMERGVLRRCQIEGSKAVRIPTEDIYRVLGLEPDARGIA